MTFSLLYLALYMDSRPLPMVLQDVALIIAGFVGCAGSVIFPITRKRTSALLRTVNEMNLDILNRTHNALENCRVSNRLFIAISTLCTLLEAAGTMAYIMFALEFVNSGLPQFNSFFHQPAPYSFMAFFDFILFWIPGIWIIYLNTYYLCMYIEFIVRISFHFHVLAGEMRQLRKGEGALKIDEEEELQKFKSLIKDSNLLYWYWMTFLGVKCNNNF